jgi:hypothetical protein
MVCPVESASKASAPGRPGFRCLGEMHRNHAASPFVFLRMNRFRTKPAMVHVAIAVALIGAAVTLGLAVWESQQGKTQGPAIIDNRRGSLGQR